MGKEKKNIEILPGDRVKLKAFLGIPPLFYVPVIYGIVVVLVLFFLFSFLLHPGRSAIEIQSFPKNAAVYVNEKYLGSTPVKADIQNSDHKITVQKRGYAVQYISFQKRNLFQNIFPTSKKLVLDLDDPRTIVQDSVENIAQYVNVDSSRRFSIPKILEDTTEEIVSLLQETTDEDARQTILTVLVQLLYHSLPYLQDYAEHQGFLKKILETHLENFDSSFAEKNDIELVNASSPRIDTQLGFIRNYLSKTTVRDAAVGDAAVRDAAVGNTRQINVLDMNFLYVPNYTVQYALTETNKNHEVLETKKILELQSRDFSKETSIQSGNLYILDHELSIAEFSYFLQAEPTWEQQSLSYVDSDFQDTHFDFVGPSSNLSDPVSTITWYDAMAYVQWFNKRLAEIDAPYLAALPNEFQWRAAQQYFASINTKNLSIRELRSLKKILETLQGSLWEWTDTWYSPLPQYNQDLTPLFGSMKTLLGGNTIHYGKENTQVLSRNYAYLPGWTTKYVGFRIILLPR